MLVRAVASRIPRDRQARRDVVLVGRHHAARHIGIAGVDEAAGRGRDISATGLPVRNPVIASFTSMNGVGNS